MKDYKEEQVEKKGGIVLHQLVGLLVCISSVVCSISFDLSA